MSERKGVATYNMRKLSKEIDANKSRFFWIVMGLVLLQPLLGMFGVTGGVALLVVFTVSFGMSFVEEWMQKRRLARIELDFIDYFTIDGVKYEIVLDEEKEEVK